MITGCVESQSVAPWMMGTIKCWGAAICCPTCVCLSVGQLIGYQALFQQVLQIAQPVVNAVAYGRWCWCRVGGCFGQAATACNHVSYRVVVYVVRAACSEIGVQNPLRYEGRFIHAACASSHCALLRMKPHNSPNQCTPGTPGANIGGLWQERCTAGDAVNIWQGLTV